MGKHDRSYRLLFSEPRLVEELVRGFFGQQWIERLDFGSLERVNASYVSEDLRNREGDVVWRAKLQDGRPVYVYLLLELQSGVQRYMAVRLMAYVALLYQDLIKRGELSPDGKLPLVIPIVLYNGEERWWAPQQLADLIEDVDPEADLFRPRLEYRLIDEGSYSLADLEARRNLAAVLFWLEKAPEPEDVRRGIARLVEWLGGPDDGGLRRAFAVWLQKVRLPGKGIKEEEVPDTLGLEDFRTMLEKRVEEWNQKLLERGRQEGRHEGEAGIVLRALERKFGRLDARSRQRVKAADADRLLDWLERISEAGQLRDIFGD
jgi:predicted transposase/invertase (TIGR01784 family)